MLLLTLTLVYGQDDISRVATGTAQFLKLGAGGRGTALGDAYSAMVNDVSAMYWNPAGIQKIGTPAIAVSRTNLYAEIIYDFAGVTYPVDKMTTVGFSVLNLSSGPIERTTIEFPEGTGDTYDTGHMALGLSLARRLTDRFDLGFTIKYINERIWREEASTLAFDIGSQFDTGIYGLKLGMILANFGGKMTFDGPDLNRNVENEDTGIKYRSGGKWKTESWRLPLLFRIGAQLDIIGGDSHIMQNMENRLSLNVEGNDPIDHFLRYNFGLEYEWRQAVALRLGYKDNYDEADYTAGFGINFAVIGIDLNVDYAFNNYGLLGYVHNYSLQFNF